MSLYWVEEGIRFVRVEDLVAVHHGDEILRVGKVDDVVGVTRKHVNDLDVVTAHLELYHLVGAYLTFLNKSVPRYYYKEFPF